MDAKELKSKLLMEKKNGYAALSEAEEERRQEGRKEG